MEPEPRQRPDEGAVVRSLPGFRFHPLDVAFEPSGAAIAVGLQDATVHVVDVATGSTSTVLATRGTGVREVAWAPQGRRLLAVGSSGDVLVWDLAEDEAVRTLRSEQLSPSADRAYLSLDADGTLLARNATHCAAWRAGDGRREVEVTPATTTALATITRVSADGRCAVGYSATGSPQFQLRPDGPSVPIELGPAAFDSFDWSPSASRAAWVSRASLWVADAPDGARTLEPRLVAARECEAMALAFDPSGRRCALVSNRTPSATIDVVDVETGRLTVHEGFPEGIGAFALDWSPDGRRIATAGTDGHVRVHDLERGVVAHTLVGHVSWVRAVAWHPDGSRLATGGIDGTLKLWDPTQGALAASFDCGAALSAVQFGPGGRVLYALDVEGAVHVWDASRSLAEALAAAE